MARQLGLDLAAAKDVVQQAFVSLFSRRPAVDDVEAWLARVVRRRSHDWRRRQARHDAVVGGSALPREPVDERSAERQLAVRSALGRLPERQRRLVEARYLYGCGDAEAALAAGYSPASYKKSMTRALNTLREELERGCKEKTPRRGRRK
jgi:RNA polymerase sigma factor (sigma-70 family)